MCWYLKQRLQRLQTGIPGEQPRGGLLQELADLRVEANGFIRQESSPGWYSPS